MSIQQAYNQWAVQYDTNENKTRDLEAKAMRSVLSGIRFSSCLEVGCGTGKNTVWFAEKAECVTAVDFSEAMLAKAREKVRDFRVSFQQADITGPWTFRERMYELVTFSLVLEHIEHLEPVLQKAAASLHPGGYVFIGELHPFKQYSGSKARFDTAEGLQVVDCYTHHVSDFTRAAQANGLHIVAIDEYFDDNNRADIPRILTLLLQKGE
ncbi:Methyltransferase domain-containing protein [Filimonas lacunae]|uniref:Methyltransferase domain-containing protein n=1 Tax=Filimonas lacunae TaxID=477680 RepID=A0A173MFK1_9BACT|nr:class I SAM-dependent methyltransferase [Filimonas lacunae]BAV06270.1 3-demethylubiquinone-9 3-methyltransferase [Filimonas lacunae]SIT25574.1 Methyltransferase domain-containing protein [Filimonas lacunae]